MPVMNSPRAIERSVDKFYTTALLQEAGLPTPETVVCERAETRWRRSRDARRGRWATSIIKPIFGSMGHGMVRVSDPDVAFRVVRALEQMRAVFYVQRAVDHGGRDIRVFVVGGRVLGAIERQRARGEWRTNVVARRDGAAVRPAARVGASWRCARRRPSAPTTPAWTCCRRATATVFVLEVNGIPGWQGLQQATGLDVAARSSSTWSSRVRRDGARAVAERPA